MTLGLNSASRQAEQNQFLNPPPEYIEYFSFGFPESMSDSIWLRWIQDADNCQTYLKPVETLEKSPVNIHDLTDDQRGKNCDSSWSFKMLDAVTRLDRKFLMPYLAGASTLAVLVEDYVGATVLYERGLAEYPDNWLLLYRAAYHYQFDLKDRLKAAELLGRAADHGGPVWLKSLAARLMTEAGEIELGLRTLENYRKSIEDHASKEALELIDKRIRGLKARL
jgi:hypothetical protein